MRRSPADFQCLRFHEIAPLIQASTSYESNQCFSKSSEKLPEMTKFFGIEIDNFCQQAFGNFSVCFGQLAGKL